MQARALVLGANGFLGSHVARALVAQGRDVRVMVRPTSDVRALEGLRVERVHGDVLDRASLERAMAGRHTVFYCVVDTRAWLRDPSPLFRTNVEGLRNAIDAALAAGVSRFVFTSSIVTIGRNPSGVATEADAFDWPDAPAYARSRVQAEALVVAAARERGLPAVICCVGNTFGANDFGPTPHGKLLYDAARGLLPITWPGRFSCVGITDAADALLLAETRGVVGERYAIVERALGFDELFRLGAQAYGRKPLFVPLSLRTMYALGAAADALAKLLRTSFRVSTESVRFTHVMSDVDGSRARRELGWTPRPIEASIEAAIRFFARR